MRLLIAAQACLLLLGLDRDGFAGITSVIVHQRPVVLRGDRAHDVAGVRVAGPQTLIGQATYRGPVLLSWPAVASGARFPRARPQRRVPRVRASTRHARRRRSTERRRSTTPRHCAAGSPSALPPTARSVLDSGSPVLRDYAGVNPGEFFAVATEVFFCRPLELRTHERRSVRRDGRVLPAGPGGARRACRLRRASGVRLLTDD